MEKRGPPPQPRNFSALSGSPHGGRPASGSERVARALPQMPKAKTAAAVEAPAVPGEAPFYIPATGSASRPRRTLKHNDTFAVFDSHGDIGASGGGPDGLFDCDTRYPLAPRAVDQRHPAAAAGLRDQGRQPQLLRRPHQPRHLRRRPDRAAEGHGARRAHDLFVRRLPARAHSAHQPRRGRSTADAVADLRQRLRRHLRGARHPPQTPRPGLGDGARVQAESRCSTAGSTMPCARRH